MSSVTAPSNARFTIGSGAIWLCSPIHRWKMLLPTKMMPPDAGVSARTDIEYWVCSARTAARIAARRFIEATPSTSGDFDPALAGDLELPLRDLGEPLGRTLQAAEREEVDASQAALRLL